MMTLENVVKAVGLIVALGTIIWKAGVLQADLKGNYNLLSYQMGELSKQSATENRRVEGEVGDLKVRTGRIEGVLMGTGRTAE
jgi:hypothetical protein